MLKLVAPVGGALVLCAFATRTPLAPHDPCKVLTAETFSKIMGYAATVNRVVSTATTCFYIGPKNEGGQFMILTEAADEARAEAMIKPRKGSTPPAGSGLVGGMFRQGSIVFSVTVRSNDQAKLQALVAEIKRGLK
ncbi:MAG TPA: hypothetical protein VHE78_00270 [Gemmatimonadaceae bacterium]|nr:hypothetical protein [Gemmatimonadaceae bacterium]